MIKSWTASILVSAAAITVPVAVTALAGAAFDATARAAVGETGGDVAAERIDGAFFSVPTMKIDPIIAAAAARTSKGDLSQADCASATWPNIDAACTTTADGLPALPVRTVGDQAGVNTTILLRIPSPR